ncbi:hypothetical protein GGTG_11355 [Gaeumannomyces tritici R3-111a-1]|uniref:Uncharacterized protein n=1 Tax=Gaeumannomyces tritici (strain R3-111a-1) TaxID=644352 RepID=J3PCY3_GAET3|nr:hypothetical protein GGTG_11355 [Gaeumannomyces tritici R3-111a-1]EJT72108.1 hypothetical protein GGTG_11355 [Gaeumannomyces tritici R3-111a-1]
MRMRVKISFVIVKSTRETARQKAGSVKCTGETARQKKEERGAGSQPGTDPPRGYAGELPVLRPKHNGKVKK